MQAEKLAEEGDRTLLLQGQPLPLDEIEHAEPQSLERQTMEQGPDSLALDVATTPRPQPHPQ